MTAFREKLLEQACSRFKKDRFPPDYYERGIEKHWVQRYWHKKRCEVIGRLVERINGRVLDVGCDGGFLTDKIRNSSGVPVVGLDLNKDSVYHAKECYSLPVLVGDGIHLPFRSEVFDLITCIEVLEHSQHPDKIIEESYRCLKRGGYFIVFVPSNNLLFRLIWFFWSGTFGRTWKGAHVYSFNERGLRTLLENNDMKIVNTVKFHLRMLIAVKTLKT